MKKHIHVHLHGFTKTKDAGTAHDPSNGQFTTSGSSGGNAAHHQSKSYEHERARKALPMDHPHRDEHNKAARRHDEAASYLSYARQAHGVGNHELAKAHHETAQRAANQAAHHEAKLEGGVHHADLKPGDALHDQSGKKVDEVEGVGKAMHAKERTVSTRAGYDKPTQGGRLKGLFKS